MQTVQVSAARLAFSSPLVARGASSRPNPPCQPVETPLVPAVARERWPDRKNNDFICNYAIMRPSDSILEVVHEAEVHSGFLFVCSHSDGRRLGVGASRVRSFLRPEQISDHARNGDGVPVAESARLRDV